MGTFQWNLAEFILGLVGVILLIVSIALQDRDYTATNLDIEVLISVFMAIALFVLIFMLGMEVFSSLEVTVKQ